MNKKQRKLARSALVAELEQLGFSVTTDYMNDFSRSDIWVVSYDFINCLYYPEDPKEPIKNIILGTVNQAQRVSARLFEAGYVLYSPIDFFKNIDGRDCYSRSSGGMYIRKEY